MITFARIVGIVGITLPFLAAGCQGIGQPRVLGVPPAEAAVITPIGSLSATAPLPQTIRGSMIEKCPIAGCWFRVQDATGMIKVDTKASGFVVSDIPLNAQVTVSGIIPVGAGEKEIMASGLRY